MTCNNTDKGEFRIGLKNFADLTPSKVRDNLTNAIKIKQWDSPNKTAIAEISRKLNEFEAQNSGRYILIISIYLFINCLNCHLR